MNDIFLEKSLPASPEMERAILGAILLDNAVCNQAVELLNRSDFFLDSHRRIYDKMVGLCERNQPIDLLSLSDELRRAIEFEQIGGATYIASLIDGLPRTDDISHYARIVKDKAVKRALIHGCESVIVAAYDDDEGVVELAEKVVYDAAQSRTAKQFEPIGDIVLRSLLRAERIAAGEEKPGLETGFYDLDFMLCGLHKKEQIVIAARPGMGKTSLGLCIGRNVAKAGTPTGIFELEMSSEALGNRLLSMESHVELRKIRMGQMSREEWGRCSDAQHRLASMPLHVDDTGGLTMAELRSKARRGMGRLAFGLLIVDYMGLAKSERKAESRNAEVGAISRGLKDLAKELDVPIIALSQLSRANESRSDKEPQLSDLRDSGEIEQNADAVIFIHRDEYYAPDLNPGIARLLIRKQRDGETGEVQISFRKDFASFENLSRY